MKKENKDTPGLPMPPPFLMAIFLVVALAFGWKLPIPVACPWWMQVIGGAVVLSGLACAFSAVRAMFHAQTSPSPRNPTSTLVTDGPYKFTRNPIYLGFILAVIGLPLMLGFYWGAILAPVAGDAYNRLIIEREETYLERKFGKAYLDYKAKVRRWL